MDGLSGSRCDFIITVGDNFYNTGVDSIHDKKFREVWKDVYTHPSIASLPWYVLQSLSCRMEEAFS